MSEHTDGRPALTATYRLQLHAGFTFEDAAEVVPYLAQLGVSHVYMSPVLASVPGSLHGYDVLDHTRIDPELGGQEGLDRLGAVCRGAGLGVVVDIVPNHMALVAPEWANEPLWGVLREGRWSATAHWFDIDWDLLGGRLGLPVLGEPLEAVLAAGQLTLDTGHDDEGPAAGRPVVRYFEHAFPVAPDTGGPGDDVSAVLERQHYLLASWREADRVLNYRRFFEVDSLIGVRVEESDVFERTHRLLLDLHHRGVVDGFRVDHPDGLADPRGYLSMLRRSCRPGAPIWVEKILEGAEELPDWECAGTTGYDANAALQHALVDPGTVEEVDRAWVQVGGRPSFTELAEETKRAAVHRLLGPEVARLHRLARRVLPHEEPEQVREALVELLVAVDRYRVYIRPGHTPDQDEEDRLREVVHTAAARRPDLADTLSALAEVLVAPETYGHDTGAGRDLAVRFQQTTGPVMAKGIEDTAFYRWHRLVALNEVGADPAAPADPAALHTWAERQASHWPDGMTTLSTHDTKRSEDVRARLLAVAGDAAAWKRCTEVYAAAAEQRGVDGPTAHLIWQTLVGAGDASLGADRLAAYLTKALREAKEHTSWVDVDEAYEERVLGLAREATGGGPLLDVVRDAVAASQDAIRAVVLGQKLLQLMLPGVPDTYQGCETLNLSLVDPDNRRPVDFPALRELLARLHQGDAGPGGPAAHLAAEKLLVTSRALRLRARLPGAFTAGASYQPVPGGAHLLGFVRDGRVAALTVRAPHGLAAEGGWGDQLLGLPPGTWRDELGGNRHTVAVGGAGQEHGTLRCADVFGSRPVALLVR